MLPVFAHVPEFAARAGKGVLSNRLMASAANASERTARKMGKIPRVMATSYRRLEDNQNPCRHGGSDRIIELLASAKKFFC
jgi:hypothetical protein